MATCSQVSYERTLNINNYANNYSPTPLWSCIRNITFSGTTASYGSELDTSASIDTVITNAHINNVLQANNAVGPSSLERTNTADGYSLTYSTNSATLRSKIQNEYCYYFKAYQYGLNLLFTNIITPPDPTYLTSQAYTTLKNNVTKLNTKLTQIITVMQKINVQRSATLTTLYNAGSTTDTVNSINVNDWNSDLDATKKKLISNSTALKNKYLDKDVKLAMIDYTLEKNSSSSNLLAIYGFMNIVAVGMLYYLYRSSRVP